MSADHGHWVWENGEDPDNGIHGARGKTMMQGRMAISCGYYAAGAMGDTWKSAPAMLPTADLRVPD